MSIEEKAGQLSIYSDPVRGGGKIVNPGQVTQGLDELKAASPRRVGRRVQRHRRRTPAASCRRSRSSRARAKIPLIFAADVIHGMPHHLPGAAGRGGELRPRPGRAHRARGRGRGVRRRASTGPSRRWSTSRATSAGAASSEGAGEDPLLGEHVRRARASAASRAATLPRRCACSPAPSISPPMARCRAAWTTTPPTFPRRRCAKSICRAFKAAFDAGALSTMSSFNDIAGVPSTGNH